MKTTDRDMFQVAPRNTMHPINRLHLQVAWADETETYWDSLGGDNYQYEFNMTLRGWDHFLSVGLSPNPHGGIGFLHYRNLLSNYGRFANARELDGNSNRGCSMPSAAKTTARPGKTSLPSTTWTYIS